MSRDNDFEIKQAIGVVAKLGGYTIKKVSTADDFKERSLTITIIRPSSGWVQESLEFEDQPVQVATVDANGHVQSVETLKTGDLAETGAEADAQIAAEAATDPDEASQIEESQRALESQKSRR